MNIENKVKNVVGKQDIIFFGHTHRAERKTIDGIDFINPGSGDETYAIITFNGGDYISEFRKL